MPQLYKKYSLRISTVLTKKLLISPYQNLPQITKGNLYIRMLRLIVNTWKMIFLYETVTITFAFLVVVI